MLRTITTTLLLLTALVRLAAAQDWPRFRGPNGSGVLETKPLPIEVGAKSHVRWKTALPPGHSSPVVADDRVFLTAFGEDELVTLCLRGDDGSVLWRRAIERPRKQRHHKNNNPASPTPVADGRSVYAFFPDFGLVAYSRGGEELWRLPLGPFRIFQGASSSPILAGETLVQACDQDAGSFLAFVDTASGALRRRVERYGPSYSSPVVHQGAQGCEVIVAGTGELAAYDCATAERRWWVKGLPYQPKSSPIVASVEGQDLAVFHAQSIDDLEAALPPFAKQLSEHDVDGDGRITPHEMPFSAMLDSDGDGFLVAAEYEGIRQMGRAPHALVAVRLGQRGDLTEKVVWRDSRSIPNLTTPIVYRGTLYVLKENGILSSLDPRTGEVHKRGRVSSAAGEYYASPVASGGRLYLASLDGDVVVVKAAPDWQVESVGSLGEPVFATPAIAGGRLFVRTVSALYCFEKGLP
jgi:outer membrane protein assembly factor BamB